MVENNFEIILTRFGSWVLASEYVNIYLQRFAYCV